MRSRAISLSGGAGVVAGARADVTLVVFQLDLQLMPAGVGNVSRLEIKNISILYFFENIDKRIFEIGKGTDGKYATACCFGQPPQHLRLRSFVVNEFFTRYRLKVHARARIDPDHVDDGL